MLVASREIMKRPPSISLRIRQELIDLIKAAATERETNMSHWIRQTLKEAAKQVLAQSKANKG